MPKGPAMSNADREFELHTHYWFVVGYFALCSVGLCIWGIAAAFGVVAPGCRLSSTAAKIGAFCLFQVGTVFFAFAAIQWTTRYVGRRFRLVFTDTAILLTEGTPLWSRKLISILYADVRKARYTTIGHERRIKIVFAGGRFLVNSTILPRKEDFDELLSELTRRLEPFGMDVETNEFSLRRPQFSLRFMFVITTIVAVGLGIRMYLEPEFSPADLFLLSTVPAVALAYVWLIFFANWTARIFVVGFALGGLLEVCALCVRVTGNMPQVPCSFNLICHFVPRVDTGSIEAYYALWISLGAMTTSGIFAGTAAMLVWLVGRRIIRARRNADASGSPPR